MHNISGGSSKQAGCYNPTEGWHGHQALLGSLLLQASRLSVTKPLELIGGYSWCGAKGRAVGGWQTSLRYCDISSGLTGPEGSEIGKLELMTSVMLGSRSETCAHVVGTGMSRLCVELALRGGEPATLVSWKSSSILSCAALETTGGGESLELVSNPRRWSSVVALETVGL